MTSKQYISRMEKYASIFVDELSDYEKLTEEQIGIIRIMQGDIFNGIGDWKMVNKGNPLKIYEL